MSNPLLDYEDRQQILESTGIFAALESGDQVLVTEPQYGFPQADFAGLGANIDAVNPSCWIDADDMETYGIVSGETGSILTIDGKDYRVLAAEAQRSGFVVIELGAV